MPFQQTLPLPRSHIVISTARILSNIGELEEITDRGSLANFSLTPENDNCIFKYLTLGKYLHTAAAFACSEAPTSQHLALKNLLASVSKLYSWGCNNGAQRLEGCTRARVRLCVCVWVCWRRVWGQGVSHVYKTGSLGSVRNIAENNFSWWESLCTRGTKL